MRPTGATATAIAAAALMAAFVLAAELAADLATAGGALASAAPVALPDRNPKWVPAADGGEAGPDYDSLLKPVLAYPISQSDSDAFQDAVSAAYKDDGDGARAAIGRIEDPVLKKVALWYAYSSDDPPADAAAIAAFAKDNPDWPWQERLRAAAERSLFMTGSDAETVTGFFAGQPPETGAGKAAVATARLASGDKAGAERIAKEAWRRDEMDEAVEKKFLASFGGMLTPDDTRARIDMLLYPDDPGLTSDALRTAKLLPEADRKKVAARVAVVKRRAAAGKLLEAIPDADAKGDVGLLYNRVQYLRRHDKEKEAWELLLTAPTDPARLGDLDAWWIERRINCRMALRFKHYDIAYRIAAEHGPITGASYDEAEFLAGWIALRYVGAPKAALSHFTALSAAATDSKTKSRAEYWLGRTAEALGDRRTAILHYAAASRYPQHYYGQLGRQALDAHPAPLSVTPTPEPKPADIERFLNRDAVKAIGAVIAADYDQLSPYFFIALARELNSPEEVVLLAELAKRTGNRQTSIRLAKIAFNRDLPVGDYALPLGVIPHFVRLSDKVDLALVHALSRQESEFNADAESPAGARGLMQLMPSTARLVARQFKVAYSPARLTDPAYNVQLGEAHLGDLIKRYDGSYFLALVAYNAGPGRVKDWIEAFGDPRDPTVDPIDWVESIPYTETRNYVVKIMESLQLYRSRLSGRDKALQLLQDLNRGRKNIPESHKAVSVQASSD